ncbi:MAG: response regulator [Ardenticatenaceae bacterium]|nr:response regulator [Ardenticatenaceae bacterium]
MKHSVLIVDDNPEARSLLRLMLRPITAQVWEANNGDEALSQARIHHPDLIILDFMMPDMNGVEVCSQLRQESATAHIPTILLTARQDQKVVEAGRISGVTRFLFKPTSRQELIETTQEILSAPITSMPVAA